uniref:Protein SSUH2 homolog isoform X1 n=1 Tax=Crassostrea virginica TaxID=6565 RepID=A0A8B8A9N9_CRAVI|nr:protein SSUH2 homolog isoform X1 [Crassostrea virginica]XP_022287874.1 protein SSUH2 homolog isoform X2 [Crassostrea virginica]XP_022287875.1 protein SSUH2 homolog isoform X2 [Crassostrea virginica]
MAKIGPIELEQNATEDEEDVLVDLNGEDNDDKPDINFLPVPGYDNVRLDQSLLPPPPTDFIPATDQGQPEFMSEPVISEETARQALIELVERNCCWGKGAAKSLTFQELQSSTSYHYVLQTFTEDRNSKWDHVPYNGQFVDGPENGSAPAPWDISATFAELFKNETQHHEVPHTAFVQPCHKCKATGKVTCGRCRGSGKVNCRSCGGRGRKTVTRNGKTQSTSCSWCFRGKVRCSNCSGSGKVTCPSCKGCRHLKWFIKLTIDWKNNVADHVVQKTQLPAFLISQSTGTLGFQDMQPRVLPISRFPTAEINEASHRLLHEHQFPQRRIHMQQHVIRMVPVTQCFCKRRVKEFTFYVYGLESKVHAPEYPDQCCWGCTIL